MMEVTMTPQFRMKINNKTSKSHSLESRDQPPSSLGRQKKQVRTKSGHTRLALAKRILMMRQKRITILTIVSHPKLLDQM